MKEKARLAKAAVRSYVRTSEDKHGAAESLSHSASRGLRAVTNPPDISGSLKKAGTALVVAIPDPISDVAGLALIGAGFAMRSRKPMSLEAMLLETRKTLRDLQSGL
ncbi:MAG: hypothetical protein OK456_00950 [Thaumarchaeota archaeon]|nr:hypothetical protein [Nitrososphaerota archaeon]